MQWGTIRINGGNWHTITFHIPFNSKPCMSFTDFSETNSGVAQGFLGGGTFTTASSKYTKCTVAYAGSGAYTDDSYCHWIAIGY